MNMTICCRPCGRSASTLTSTARSSASTPAIKTTMRAELLAAAPRRAALKSAAPLHSLVRQIRARLALGVVDWRGPDRYAAPLESNERRPTRRRRHSRRPSPAESRSLLFRAFAVASFFFFSRRAPARMPWAAVAFAGELVDRSVVRLRRTSCPGASRWPRPPR
jgi:hypothetical protein